MSWLRILLPLLCVLFAGCRPGSLSQGDEQKDPYFLSGKNHLQERDYQGAIEMFEKALDVNPRSASAHFELGVLYEQQQNDYAASLYHYQRASTLNSNAPFAELARQRMQECKRELAKSIVQPISTDQMQREIDALRLKNQQLEQRLREWQEFRGARGGATSNAVPPNLRVPSAAEPPTAVRTAVLAKADTLPSSFRTHTIASGETLDRIARRYNVKLSTLQSANPTIDAKRLRPGQTLVIPPP
jgi:tetratricopeptide (TPR) repeat protein